MNLCIGAKRFANLLMFTRGVALKWTPDLHTVSNFEGYKSFRSISPISDGHLSNKLRLWPTLSNE